MTDETRALNATIDRPSPEVIKAFANLSPNELCDVLELSCVMRYEVRPLWPEITRVAGPAFTIRTGKHDNLMFHASIYLAQPGDVIVVEAGDDEMAVEVVMGLARDIPGLRPLRVGPLENSKWVESLTPLLLNAAILNHLHDPSIRIVPWSPDEK